ncbi:MAG: hypothetical protein AAF604_20390 [Acidobacteriota bacterium]
MALTLVVVLATSACSAWEGSPARSGEPRSEVATSETESAIVLSADLPRVAVPLDRKLIAWRPPILEAEIVALENPNLAPFSIALALRTSGGEMLRIGRFAVYPADREGRFQLHASGAWAQLPETVSKVELVVELKDHEESADLSLDLMIRWQTEP